MSDSATFVLAMLAGYAHASLIESWCHDKVHHARKMTLARFKTWPLVGRRLRRSQQSHTVLHHGMTFRDSYLIQFASPEKQRRGDIYVQDNQLDPKNRYGLSLSYLGILPFLAPFMILTTAVVLATSPLYSVPFALMSLISPALSKFVHPYLHANYERSVVSAPFVIRQILRSPLGPPMWIRHYLHHRDQRLNFNLMLPIGDWLRGVWRRATPAELEEIGRIGGPSSSSYFDGR